MRIICCHINIKINLLVGFCLCNSNNGASAIEGDVFRCSLVLNSGHAVAVHLEAPFHIAAVFAVLDPSESLFGMFCAPA